MRHRGGEVQAAARGRFRARPVRLPRAFIPTSGSQFGPTTWTFCCQSGPGKTSASGRSLGGGGYQTNRSILFWAAYALTRPHGATLGETLTMPFEHGGLNLSRTGSSLAMVVAIEVTGLRRSTPSAMVRTGS